MLFKHFFLILIFINHVKMKQLILAFFCIFCSVFAIAQNEFAQIGSIWKYTVGTSSFSPDYHEQAESVKDTLINNLIYKKVVVTTQNRTVCGTYPNCPLGFFVSARYFRQSNDSLFEYDYEKDSYFFSYNLKVGDTLMPQLRRAIGASRNGYKVTRLVDTNIQGQKLKKWSLIYLCQGSFNYRKNDFVQHLGALYGPMTMLPNQCGLDGTSYYLCGFENKNIVYNSGCSFVNTNELTGNKGIKIAPNPAYNTLLIDAPDSQISSIKMYDLCGVLVKNVQGISTNGKGGTEREPIDISDLKTGVYCVQFIDFQHNSVTKKFIKM
jgi:hypothetical protein